MFKRIMSVMLAVVMLMAVAVVAVSAESSDKLYIRVDNGDYYEVNKGDVITYEYALSCDKKVCSLDCTTYFDAEGLKFVPVVDEYGDYTGVEFPNLVGPVFNFGLEGKIVYNYSNVTGVRFPVNDTPIDKNIVFKGAFEVTAESGIYDIYTDLKVLGDNSNNKIIFDGVQVDETSTVVESGRLPELTAVEPPTETKPTETEATQPTTVEPTAEPTTVEPTTVEPTTVEPTTVEPTEEETTPAAATKDQSSTTDNKKPTNSNAVKTGTTAAAIAFITILVMVAGVVMFSSKRKFN